MTHKEHVDQKQTRFLPAATKLAKVPCRYSFVREKSSFRFQVCSLVATFLTVSLKNFFYTSARQSSGLFCRGKGISSSVNTRFSIIREIWCQKMAWSISSFTSLGILDVMWWVCLLKKRLNRLLPRKILFCVIFLPQTVFLRANSVTYGWNFRNFTWFFISVWNVSDPPCSVICCIDFFWTIYFIFSAL